jgi:glutamate-5-semialdehyde dehydrogenase
VEEGIKAGLTTALIDRLLLTETRFSGIISDLHNVAALPDPIGDTIEEEILPNNLYVRKQRVPVGVLGVIYEAKPNVTVDVTGLTIKSGNAVILRGGMETLNSNRTLVKIIRETLADNEFPPDSVQFIDDTDRARVAEMLSMHQVIDMIIPRGGAGLHKFCRENSMIPVITGGIGICHLYVDETADLNAAIKVVQNAKVQRPSVCNALDTVLVHHSVAERFIPNMIESLKLDGVTFRIDEITFSLLRDRFSDVVKNAGPEDFDTEWLSLILGVKVIEGIEQAIDFISVHSTGHSDGILTRDQDHAKLFTAEVDSAVVYVNASTRFTDGGQLGLGAEIAISTQRLHARGPMALKELTTYKWVIEGDYHTR